MSHHTVSVSNRHIGEIEPIRLHPDDDWIKFRYRWITRYDYKTNRYYGRAPKLGTYIKDLKYKRDIDFGPERPLHSKAKIWRNY